MTEAEWLACEEVEVIAEATRRIASDRKIRLIACGCCRVAWAMLVDERSREAVEASERFADGSATRSDLGKAAWLAEAAVFAVDGKRARYRLDQKAIRQGWLSAADAAENGIETRGRALVPFDSAHSAAACAEAATADPASVMRELPNPIFSLAVLRDVVGNPFRPVAFSLAWRTDTALTLARQMYESRDFGAMPILADALQDAGCEQEAILNHCRDANATHVRGCWVVDLVLGNA